MCDCGAGKCIREQCDECDDANQDEQSLSSVFGVLKGETMIASLRQTFFWSENEVKRTRDFRMKISHNRAANAFKSGIRSEVEVLYKNSLYWLTDGGMWTSADSLAFCYHLKTNKTRSTAEKVP